MLVTSIFFFSHIVIQKTLLKMAISLCDKSRKRGKRRKCRSPAFSSFPTLFSKTFLYRLVNCPEHVAKSYEHKTLPVFSSRTCLTKPPFSSCCTSPRFCNSCNCSNTTASSASIILVK